MEKENPQTEQLGQALQAKAGKFVATDPMAAQIQFVDLVISHCDSEKVILAFIQKWPVVSPNSENEMVDGRIVAQIAITWPHLVRIRDLFTRVIERHQQEVAQAYKFFSSEAGSNDT